MPWIDELYRRVRARWWLITDVALTVILTVLTLSYADSDKDGPWLVFAVPMVLGLLVRRPWPLAALIMTVVGALGHHLTDFSGAEPLDLAVPITLFTLADADHLRRTATRAFAVLIALVVLLSVPQPFLHPEKATSVARTERVLKRNALPVLPIGPVARAVEPPDEVEETSTRIFATVWRSAGLIFLLGFAFLLGANTRGRRLHLRTLEQRATDLEREQRQRVALATAAERARITRELHDVVAHGLSVMVVQAQGGAAALRRHPERTETALQNVITTGRSSLEEMRRLLAVARQDPAADPELAPAPGVEALPDLVDTIRAAGTPVTFAVEGDPIPLPAALDLSAYRIAQEALTNTLKHAGTGARATVRLGFHPDHVEIEINDTGARPRPSPRKPAPAATAPHRPNTPTAPQRSAAPNPAALSPAALSPAALNPAALNPALLSPSVQSRSAEPQRAHGSVATSSSDVADLARDLANPALSDEPGRTHGLGRANEPDWADEPGRANGNGLRGIRERVGLLGGELSAGPVAAGGFRVWAVLPLSP
ncbi:histidine kinase [Actinoplanes sp. NPDC051851]|uniref:sensor histidine kinase n=1 Tax=Actinoplanes sp. NPDC051851 TaxID=3154753 RepID=UPI0034195096